MNHATPPTRDVAAARFHSLSRRRFLRGVGACLALPAMESLLPSRMFGAAATGAAATAATPGAAVTATGMPLRMAYMLFPNGVGTPNWWPTGDGKDFDLGTSLAPLAKVKDKIQIMGGLDDGCAEAGPDGPGDHGRAGGTFLTCVRVKKSQTEVRAGISVDQVTAQQVGHLTPFASLQMSCDTVQNSNNCDSGYACAYQHNLSWSSPTTPLAPETNPRLLFERLFGAGTTATERKQNMQLRQAQQSSVLDFVSSETKSLGGDLSSRDHQKLDEFLTSVREIEQRIQRAESAVNFRADPGVSSPAGIPVLFSEYVRLNLDMLHLAFLTDNTRVASFIFSPDGNNRDFHEIGIPEGHHFCTHHGNKPDLLAKTCKIDNWYASQLAYFLEKLDQTKDLDGNSMLHNSMIVYGCGNSDGNRHTHKNLPIILAGSGGGTFKPGRYMDNNSVPISNLYLSMMDRMGVTNLPRFGDSSGRLTDV